MYTTPAIQLHNSYYNYIYRLYIFYRVEPVYAPIEKFTGPLEKVRRNGDLHPSSSNNNKIIYIKYIQSGNIYITQKKCLQVYTSTKRKSFRVQKPKIHKLLGKDNIVSYLLKTKIFESNISYTEIVNLYFCSFTNIYILHNI